MKPFRAYLLGSLKSQPKHVFVWARNEIAAKIKAGRENKGMKVSRVELISRSAATQ